MLAAGLAAAAALAGVAFAKRDAGGTVRPTASWNMYSATQWSRFAMRSRLHGLHVVAATSKWDGTPVALIAGTRSGRTCFVPATGTALGATVCRFDRPLTLIRVRDRGWNELLGIARPDVASVAQTSTSSTGPWTSGEPLVRAGRAYVFAGGGSGKLTRVVARDRRGRVLQSISIR